MAVVKLNHGNAGAHLVGIYAGVEDLFPEISIDDSYFLVSHLVRFVDAIATAEKPITPEILIVTLP